MMQFLAAVDFLCWVAAPVLAIVFAVQWVRKKPKKWFGIVALICVAVIIGCTSIANSVLHMEEEYKAEIESLKSSNDELSSELSEAKGIITKYAAEYIKNTTDNKTTGEILVFDGLAKNISQEAICVQASSKLLQITIPIGDETPTDMNDKISDNLAAIALAFSSSDTFKAINIVVVDENGVCLFGHSIDSEFNLYTYISKAYEERK